MPLGLVPNLYEAPIAKTASYALLRTDGGKIFSTRGAGGAVTFTLPAIADVPTGWSARFFNVVNQDMVITAPSGKLSAFNNAAGTTATFSTVNEKIGAAVEVIFDGTTYQLYLLSKNTVVIS